MNTIRAIQKLNKRELEEGISPEGSWHTDYRDTAFIYVGGFPYELSEGDIITIFSQYGEPVWIKLARDKETGKSKGFCWLKYEDQRSTDLAVDNLGGATLMGRALRVDHTRYKPRDDEDMRDNTMGELEVDENEDRRKRRRTESESESDEDRPMLKEEVEFEKLQRDLDDDDPMKSSMLRKKQEEVDAALKKMKRAKQKERKHRSKHHREGSRDHRNVNNREDKRNDSRDRRHIKDKEDKRDSRPRHRRDTSTDSEQESRRKRRDEDGHRDRKSRDRDDSEGRDRHRDRREHK
jgi:RNA-binding motif X-linked protein 2